MELTHFDVAGRAHMVNVTDKQDTDRVAVAAGRVVMAAETLSRIEAGLIGKGDVLAVAQVAGIMAAKKTWEIIPMCHPLLLTGVSISFAIDAKASAIDIQAEVKTTGKTGVEMEALTAVEVGLLTIYDMCKAIDRGMVLSDIRLLDKAGGKSGHWVSDSPAPQLDK